MTCFKKFQVHCTSAVKGVNSEGFMTIVQPTARAGATFQDLEYQAVRRNELQRNRR